MWFCLITMKMQNDQMIMTQIPLDCAKPSREWWLLSKYIQNHNRMKDKRLTE